MDALDALRAVPDRIAALEREVSRLAALVETLTGPGDGYLSVASAAKLLDVSASKVDHDARAGVIPSVKYGGRRLIPRRDLVALLESGRLALVPS